MGDDTQTAWLCRWKSENETNSFPIALKDFVFWGGDGFRDASHKSVSVYDRSYKERKKDFFLKWVSLLFLRCRVRKKAEMRNVFSGSSVFPPCRCQIEHDSWL